MLETSYTICKSCDHIIAMPPFTKGEKCICPHCGATLRSAYDFNLQLCASCALAALVLFLLVIFEPFLSLSVFGVKRVIALADIFFALQTDWTLLLPIFLFFTFIFPIIMLSMQVLVGLLKYKPSINAAIIYSIAHKYCFIDVFVLGVLVSLVKLVAIVDVTFFDGFYLMFLFSFISIWCSYYFKPSLFWSLILDTRLHLQSELKEHVGSRAIDVGFVYCHHCECIHKDSIDKRCPRCHRHSDFRIQSSLETTCAFLATAMILFIPSNIYPIMITGYLGNDIGSNIIDGVISLIEFKSYFVAIVILIASICIPIFKIVSMLLLVIYINYKTKIDKKRLSYLYRLVEFIGKWSMIDVFVVIFMTSAVTFTGLLTVQPGIAIVVFSLVVLVTMFAAHSFDERLIWDKK